MKYLLLLTIKIYWLTIPKQKRNKCIFKKSCSNYVFDITKQEGLIKGLKALKNRFENCRPGYSEIDIEDETYIITVNSNIYKLAEMRKDILK